MTSKLDPRIPELLRDYLKLTEGGEAATKLHAVCGIAGCAALLGRRVWLEQGRGKLFPNDYLMIVGMPATKKSTAIKSIVRSLREVGYKFISPSKITKQKLFEELEGIGRQNAAAGKEQEISLDAWSLSGDSEMLIQHDEFGNFLGQGENAADFIGLLNELYDIDTSYEYQTLKSKSFLIDRIAINVLGGTTPNNFSAMFGSGVAAGGILSRFVLVAAMPSGVRKFQMPVPSPELIEKFNQGFRLVRNLSGVMRYSHEAFKLAKAIHEQPQKTDEGVFQHYGSRRDLHRTKLAMTLACMRGKLEISADDVTLAHTFLTHHEYQLPQAIGEYGAARNAVSAQQVVTALRGAMRVMPARELYAVVSNDLTGYLDFERLVNKLVLSNKIQSVDGGYLPIINSRVFKPDSFVNWDLLVSILDDFELANLKSIIS